MRNILSQNKSKQSGISLIEVLISMALGIFFLGVAVEYLIVGQQSSSVQDAGSRIQENARFAMDIIRDDLRLAGYSSEPSRVPPFIYRDACENDPCADDTADGDRLAVSYVTDTDVSEDCVGTEDIPEGTQIVNVYWIEESVQGIQSLFCRSWDAKGEIDGSGSAGWVEDSQAQPLVDGIDSMQVLYGVSDLQGGSTNRFLSAADVLDWSTVRAVRVALLVSSGLQTDDSDRAGSNALVDENKTYELLDETWDADDQKIRRVYATTIELNNSF